MPARALIIVLIAGCAARPALPVPEPVRVAACDAPGADADGDGLSDACELALAQAFAPVLVAAAGECNIVGEGDARRIGGGYLHAAAPHPGGVRIAWLPSYFRDCGWRGAKCRLPGVSCAPHDGDSEFIAVEVERQGGGWVAAAVFLSAHCFGRSSGGCRWYDSRELGRFEWAGPVRGSGPVVWVANGRNANYPDRAACDRGHRFLDTCSGERIRYVHPVAAGLNIGSRVRPAALGDGPPGCAASRAVDPAGAHTHDRTVECFWDADARFRGWQDGAGGVTPYERYLREVTEL